MSADPPLLNARGSGRRAAGRELGAQPTYALSGAQLGGATVASRSTTVPITATGVTKLAYSADDNAGNTASNAMQLIAVASSPVPVACASTPLNAASIPANGAGTIAGTLTINSKSVPFSIAL